MRAVPPLGAADGIPFTDGNPAAGVEGSPIPAEFFNALNAEVVNVIKQGLGTTAPSAGNLTQLYQAIAALIASGLNNLATPPQFDNDTSPATTAFVQRALGNHRALGAISTNTTLAAADAGRALTIGGATMITMPPANTVPNGGAYALRNANSGTDVTIVRQGADQFSLGPSSPASTSITLKSADSIELVSNGIDGWVAVDGTAGLASSGQFAASAFASANAFQKLPTGLIIQWGSVLSPATAGAPQAVSFPIAFPNACRSIVATTGHYSTTMESAWIDSLTVTGVNLRGSAPGNTIFWMATGH